MPVFYFDIHRAHDRTQDEIGCDLPDCGMAFREARERIRRIARAESLSDAERARTFMRVTYSDRSELFNLPFDLGI